MKVLVTEKLSDAGLDLLRKDFEVDVRPELAADGLPEAIAPYDALVVRSQTQVTADVKASVEAVSKQLGALGLPVGWRYDDENRGGMDEGLASKTPDAQRRYRIENRIWPRSLAEWKDQLGSHLLGWVLTAFALSFGAPFWFDMLNKIMVIRSTVKPREKSGEEGSEDRPVRAQGQTVRIEVAGAKP